jgi:phage shock protein A
LTDIVERLRHKIPLTIVDIREAADEIERRRADIAHLDTKLDDALDEIGRLRAAWSECVALNTALDADYKDAEDEIDALKKAAKVSYTTGEADAFIIRKMFMDLKAFAERIAELEKKLETGIDPAGKVG